MHEVCICKSCLFQLTGCNFDRISFCKAKLLKKLFLFCQAVISLRVALQQDFFFLLNSLKLKQKCLNPFIFHAANSTLKIFNPVNNFSYISSSESLFEPYLGCFILLCNLLCQSYLFQLTQILPTGSVLEPEPDFLAGAEAGEKAPAPDPGCSCLA